MRVVAGTARGRRLDAPAGATVRPTSDRVREATFNALGSLGWVADASVLDLFSGSGALGIEALSRGAARAVLVDRDRGSIAATRANVERCALEGRARVVRSEADDFLRSTSERFDLVLLDPPYAYDDWDVLLALVDAPHLVVESDRVVELGAAWRVRRERRYGDTVVQIASRVDQQLVPDPQECAQ